MSVIFRVLTLMYKHVLSPVERLATVLARMWLNSSVDHLMLSHIMPLCEALMAVLALVGPLSSVHHFMPSEGIFTTILL